MIASALILAGGKATRLGGVEKHQLVVEGRTIFERQCAVLAPHVEEIIVSAPKPVSGYHTVADAIEGGGPLAGIAAGLAAVRTPWLLVVAGDMPDLTDELVKLLLSRVAEDVDAVCIRIGGLPQPLACVLAARLETNVRRRVGAGDRKASKLFTDGELRVSWIEEADVRAIDPDLRALRNVNEPTDL